MIMYLTSGVHGLIAQGDEALGLCLDFGSITQLSFFLHSKSKAVK